MPGSPASRECEDSRDARIPGIPGMPRIPWQKWEIPTESIQIHPKCTSGPRKSSDSNSGSISSGEIIQTGRKKIKNQNFYSGGMYFPSFFSGEMYIIISVLIDDADRHAEARPRVGEQAPQLRPNVSLLGPSQQ